MHSSKGMEPAFLHLTHMVRSEFTSELLRMGGAGTDSRGMPHWEGGLYFLSTWDLISQNQYESENVCCVMSKGAFLNSYRFIRGDLPSKPIVTHMLFYTERGSLTI